VVVSAARRKSTTKCTVWNGRINERTDCGLTEILSQNRLQGTEEKHEKSQNSWYSS
jgi:hypothetical protein